MNNEKFEILYIDDEQDNLDVFESTFWKDYNLHLAKSAEEGLEVLDKVDVHLIITDQQMPSMTGVEFLDKISDKFPKTMRMVLTGFGDMEAIINAINKGKIVNYITKPWKKEDLKIIIDKALETYSLRKENQRLLDELKISNGELENLNKNLEKKVKERTQELETKNTDLSNAMFILRNAQAQLLQSEKLASLGMLSAAIGHEMNNPVDMVRGALEIIKLNINYFIKMFEEAKTIDFSDPNKVERFQKELSSEEFMERKSDLSELMGDALDGSKRALSIIKSLKNFVGSGTDKWEYVNIHDGIDSTLLLLRKIFINTNIEIVKNYEKNIENMNCIPGLLNQVFMNIFSNAVDAINEESRKGIIEVTTLKTDSSIIIQIKDNGVGMSENVKQQVFEAFYSTKNQDQGTGLGLSLSKDIIDKHKGKISVTSEIGEGAEFVIELPH